MLESIYALAQSVKYVLYDQFHPKAKDGVLIWTQNGFYLNLANPIVQNRIIQELEKLKRRRK